VKRNIAAFGGDPGCVTIFGESAGAISVGALLLSPRAKGLFQRAIEQSGTVFARSQRDVSWGLEPAEKTGERIAAALGCDKAKDPLAALRAKSVDDLLAAARPSLNPFVGENAFGPVVDGYVLPDAPDVLLAGGRQHDVPLLIGTTADEGSVFVAGSAGARSREAFRTFVTNTWGKDGEKLWTRYRPASDEATPKAFAELIGDALFVAPTRAVARSRVHLGSKTFLYSFTRVPPAARPLGLGAHHGADLAYVFGNLDPPAVLGMTKEDRALSDVVMDAWVRFARTGDPNGEGSPSWPAYTLENDAHLELGDDVRARAGLRRAECDLIESVWRAMGAGDKKTRR
jgi:para-nitrobenzyl esterase